MEGEYPFLWLRSGFSFSFLLNYLQLLFFNLAPWQINFLLFLILEFSLGLEWIWIWF